VKKEKKRLKQYAEKPQQTDIHPAKRNQDATLLSCCGKSHSQNARTPSSSITTTSISVFKIRCDSDITPHFE